MPFIPHNERVDLAQGKPAETVGQLCYVEYIEMVKQWNNRPGWTTAHDIYKYMKQQLKDKEISDKTVARELAWQAFWSFYVLPYEKLKEKEHGTI